MRQIFAPMAFGLVAVLIGQIALCGDESLRVVKLGDSVVDSRAPTIVGGFGQCINGLSFQQDAVASHNGWQYVAYYNADRKVCLARRKLPESTWEIIRFDDYDFRSDDAHNTISLGICRNDGSIHLAFDHHNHPLHYRKSRPSVAAEPAKHAWEPGLFGPITAELQPGKPLTTVTYPRFWRTPEGGLQFCFRIGSSGNGDRMLADYSEKTGAWNDVRQIDSRVGTFQDRFNTSPSRCSYPNGYTYDSRGRLHVTWVWRERTQGANHDLMYAYSDDRGRTWRNNAGEIVGDSEPNGRRIRVDSPGITVVEIGRHLFLMNTHGQAVDSRGRVHTVMWHATDESLAQSPKRSREQFGPPEARRYHHYWRDDDGRWRHTELPGRVGNRPKLFFDRRDNAILIFNAPDSEASWDSRSVFYRRGNLVIMAATAAERWRDWRVIHPEPGPFVNEMLGDPYLWQEKETLSVMVQESPSQQREATPLRILDFVIKPS